MLRQLALSHQLASRYRRPALFRRPVPPSCYIPAGASILFPGAVRHFAVAVGTAPRSRRIAALNSTRLNKRWWRSRARVQRPARNRKFWLAFVPRAKRACWDMETLSFAIDGGFSVAKRRGYAAGLAVIDSV